MNIVIPFQGRVQTVIRSSFLAAKRQTETQYQLTGEAFQMTGITNAQVVILPDTINVSVSRTFCLANQICKHGCCSKRDDFGWI